MQAISSLSKDDEDTQMAGTPLNDTSLSFKSAQRLNNSTLSIVLQRTEDPNVLPFIHVILVFMYRMSRHSDAMSILRAEYPLELLSIMLNTVLVSLETTESIENDTFLSLGKDDARCLLEDFALRGLLWAEDYFPVEWFSNEKIDEEEKYYKRTSMTAQRKERILWLAVRIARSSSSGLNYHSGQLDNTKAEFSFQIEPITAASRATNFELITSRTTY